MRKKRVLSFIISIILVFAIPATALAETSADNTEPKQAQSVDEGSIEEQLPNDEIQDVDQNPAVEEAPAVKEESEAEKGAADGQADENETVTEAAKEQTEQAGTPEALADQKTADPVTVDASTWNVTDFTYETMEQTLNGCDYTRQFTIKGPAVAGFSETGTEKIKTNKNLVIPATDNEGNTLVGIAENAFSKQGIESVVFPTGMLVEYDDTVTNKVTRRGNFIIGVSSFANNNLKNVYLPDGVIAVMSSAFKSNQLETVTLPKTIWWIETVSFSNNQLTSVKFPKTCDFQLEIHGMAFASNQLKSVRLPDYTAVVNKHVFAFNPGMEACPNDAPENEKSMGGLVYMYTDNASLEYLDRIHHIGKTTASQKAWHQKLVVTGIHEVEEDWGIKDFTVDETVITGLSKTGIEKRATNKNLVLPDRNAQGAFITGIASTEKDYGLFATEGEGFETVELPNHLTKIGDRAFAKNGLKEVAFPSTIKEIGLAAFQENNLTSVILPDTVTTLGGGAFASNTALERISLSKNLKEIAAGAFGCSSSGTWMENLTAVSIPEGIEHIGNNAFAGNNLASIKIPSSVKSIGDYAFSTKNYLKTPCTVTLPEGLETIGKYAFRNKIIERIELPASVKSLPANTFTKEYSDETVVLITKVIVSSLEQYTDSASFPASDYHKLYLSESNTWTAEDFTYIETETELYPANASTDKLKLKNWAVSGLSEQGELKIEVNKNLVIPNADPDGKSVTGVAANAFKNKELETVSFPENVKADYAGSWNTQLTERGDFVIGASAFSGNNLKTADLPEGVISIGASAFNNNQLLMVNFPQTLMNIASQAFAKNQITSLKFQATCDFKLNIDNMAFAVNKIEAVQLPDKVEKIAQYAFLQNTGKENVPENATANEKKGGVVYMYCVNAAAENESLICHLGNSKSKVQKLIIASMPSVDKPWGAADFTYDETGTTLTGLSQDGKEKIKVNPNVILPSQNAQGSDIIAVGPGSNGVGTFGYKENDKLYAPKTIILPGKLTTIDNFAFSGNLFTSIRLPQTLQNIGSSAFNGSALESISIPDSVTTMGSGTFTNSKNLKSVVLSSGLKGIPQSAFAMTAIKEVVIPEGVQTLGRMAFNGTGLEKLTLSNTVTTISKQAFMNHQLSDLDIPESVKSIEQSAFTVVQEGAKASLKSLTLHEGLEAIQKEAFRNCSLSEVEIPATLTTLTVGAFAKSNKVTLKTSSTEQLIETETFKPISETHEVIYDSLVGSGWSYDDFAFDGATITGWSEKGETKRLTVDKLILPDVTKDGMAITAVGDAAFKIPDAEVTQLKDSVDSPNGMLDVHLPAKVITIGKQAFEFHNFTQIELGEHLEKIDERAFKGNKLEKVHIPDTVTTMGNGAFTMNNITDLILSKGVTVIPQAAFSMNIRLFKVEIPDTVTEIGEMAFAGARLTTLSIPKSVKKINRKAFHLHHLSELTIPGNVAEIGESAFEGTYKAQTLTTLTLETGIEKIGKYAFKEGLLREVTLPDTLNTLGEEPFYNNVGVNDKHLVVCNTSNYKHLLLDNSSTHQVKYAGPWQAALFTFDDSEVTGFSNYGKVFILQETNLTIPQKIPDKKRKEMNVTSIGKNAFKGYNIKTVILPETLETIKEGAFSKTGLKAVELPASVTTIAKTAFAECENVVKLNILNKDTYEKIKNNPPDGVDIAYTGKTPSPTPPAPTPEPTPGASVNTAVSTPQTSGTDTGTKIKSGSNNPRKTAATGEVTESSTDTTASDETTAEDIEQNACPLPNENSENTTVDEGSSNNQVATASIYLPILQKGLYILLGMAIMGVILVLFRKNKETE